MIFIAINIHDSLKNAQLPYNNTKNAKKQPKKRSFGLNYEFFKIFWSKLLPNNRA